ncbi:MAG: YegS/Rv2252/BmrU family lipid kinase [bacterium]
MKHVYFIVNPIAGAGKPKRLIESINKYIDKSLFTYEVVTSEFPGHAIALAKSAQDSADIIVAAGGDGTINEVLNGLNESKNILGILPTGSGNGLANFLKIPKTTAGAIKCINNLSYSRIDTMLVNSVKCINMAGVGFDAYVAKLFRESKNRGFLTYSRIVLSQFNKFRTQYYKLTLDDKEYSFPAFLISCANSTQFGNNAHIAPKAVATDGLLNITKLEKIPVWIAPVMIVRLFTKTIDSSRYFEGFTGKHIKISSNEKLYSHIDGEFVDFGNVLNITIQPLSLKVICAGVK